MEMIQTAFPGSREDMNPEKATSLALDGCTVYMTSNPKNTDETIFRVKEILLSAYRAKVAGG